MKTIASISAMCLLLTAAAVAQMPTPAPELKKLDQFAGSWTIDNDLKPGPMTGQGGKVSETEKCEWMQGGFFLVCHIDYSGAMGSGIGIAVMGYSAGDKTYTYHEFNSWGEFTDAKGVWEGDTLIWTSDYKMGGVPMKGRYTIKVSSSAAYNSNYEMSQDGGATWTRIMDGKASKSK